MDSLGAFHFQNRDFEALEDNQIRVASFEFQIGYASANALTGSVNNSIGCTPKAVMASFIDPTCIRNYFYGLVPYADSTIVKCDAYTSGHFVEGDMVNIKVIVLY